MPLKISYLLMRWLFGLVALVFRGDQAKDAELLVLLAEYQEHCNTARPLQGIAQRIPDGDPDTSQGSAADLDSRRICREPVLGGLINEYLRAALTSGKVQVKAQDPIFERHRLVDELPDIPGLAERWGRDVAHCPFCFGWELRDQPLGVLATGPLATAQALMWPQWSPDVTLFLDTAPRPGGEQMEQLAAPQRQGCRRRSHQC